MSAFPRGPLLCVHLLHLATSLLSLGPVLETKVSVLYIDFNALQKIGKFAFLL